MNPTTIPAFVDALAEKHPDTVWLRDRHGDDFTEWTWSDVRDEAYSASAWLASRYGSDKANIVILSRNRAHWFLADIAICASGNVTIPMFTTLAQPTAKYILEFTDAKALILGEAENWESVREILPEDVDVITLPGVEIDDPHIRWDDIVAECKGQCPDYECKHDDLITIVFTSGTTGVPKGVMQSHDSMLVPMIRAKSYFSLRPNPRFLSYLPLSHIAERQLVLVQSLVNDGVVTFNESMLHLGRADRGTVNTLDGQALRTGNPIELELALQNAVTVEGYLGLLMAFASTQDESASVLRSLLAPAMGTREFEPIYAAAASAWKACLN